MACNCDHSKRFICNSCRAAQRNRKREDSQAQKIARKERKRLEKEKPTPSSSG